MTIDRDLEQKLTLLFELNPLAVIEWDLDFRVVAWNPAATKVFGYSKEEAIGRHAAELIVSGELRILVDQVFQSLLRQTGGSNNINDNITKTGEVIVCDWHNNTLFDTQGRVTGVLSIAQNITTEVIPQRDVDGFFINSLDLLCIATFDGYFRKLNSSWSEILGYTDAELKSRPFLEFVHPEDIPLTLAEVEKLVGGQNTLNFENRYQSKDGDYKWLSWRVTVDQKSQLLYAVARDITTQKQNEEILKQKEIEIRQNEKRYQDLMEAKLLESQSFLASVLANLPVAVFAKNAQDLRMILWNQAAEELFEIKAQDIIGTNNDDLFPPEQAEFFTQKDREALNSHQLIDIPEEVVQDGQGRNRIFHTKKTPILDQEGIPQSLLVISEDITERKAAEQQLQQKADREELLNRMTNNIRSSLDFNEILQKAVTEIRNFLNIDDCHVTKYIPEDDQGVAYWEVLQEAKVPGTPETPRIYPTSVVGIISERLLDLQTIRVDNTKTYTDAPIQEILQLFGIKSIVVLPSLLGDGMFVSFSCINYQQSRIWLDEEVELLEVIMEQLAIALNQAELYQKAESRATELEKILRELQQTQGQLVQSEKMSSLGQLVAGVAHEINNPVNFIYGNLTHANEYSQDLIRLIELYQKYYPNPVAEIADEAEAVDLEFLLTDLPHLLNSMKVGADRIKQIVHSLRNFSRMDEAAMKAVNIHEGIDSTLMILQNRLKAKSDQPEIPIIKNYSNLPLVECYAGELNQVFMNILTNAIDALEERDHQRTFSECQQNPSQIDITTTLLPDKQVEIKISDNGLGIPESVQKRLFDPFFTTKAIGKGTGLGMSISYQIITERHNGSLNCESQLGQGTSFIIRIPLLQLELG